MTSDQTGTTPVDDRLAAWAAQVCHDLKNPLTGITMSLELAREEAAELDAPAGAGLVSLIDRASRGAARLEAMLDDLAAQARGESDR